MRAKILLALFCAAACLVQCECVGFVHTEEDVPESLNSPCPTNCNCTTVQRKSGNQPQVDCSYRGLKEIPDGIPAETVILKLNNNQIAEIPTGKLANLSNLLELYLNDNQLTQLDPGALEGLKSLTKLYMTRNKLTDFPDICADVGITLQHLGIDENRLVDAVVPQNYTKCTSLLSLILTKNTFSNLTVATLAALKSLQSLKMNDVQLTGIEPGALKSLTQSLMSLDLSENPNLPADQLAVTFQTAPFSTKFVGLTLKKMGWTALPPNLLPKGNFPRLDILHLDDSSELASIAAGALVGAKTLTQLFLSGSALSEWAPDTFSGMTKLRKLDLSNAQIAFVGGLDGKSNPLPSLTGLPDNGLLLGDNSLVCNCSLLWLTQQLKNASLQKKFNKVDDLKCKDSSGKSVNLIDFTPAGCNSSTTTATAPATTATAPATTATAPATTTGQHGGGGGGPTPEATGGRLPIWGVLLIASGGAVILALALAVVTLGLRLRRRRAVGGGTDMLDPLVDGQNSRSGGGGCLELLSRRGGSHVQVPDSDYTNEAA